MNAQIQQQLDRVDTALTALIDSISSYNPSLTAAHSLSSADDELREGLEQLVIHQFNYALLVHLRAKSAHLDARIKTTLSSLATTRSELLKNTPVTIPALPPADKLLSKDSATNQTTITRTTDYATLLSYAARIAKFTVPPTYRPPLPPAINDEVTTTAAEEDVQQPQQANTITDAFIPPAVTANSSNKAQTALTEAQQAWLDQMTVTGGQFFVPWPRDESIRRGALAQIQAAKDRGIGADEVEDLDLSGQPVGDAMNVEEALEEEVDRKILDIHNGEMQQRKESFDVGASFTGRRTKRKEEELVKEEVFEGFELYNPDE